jgi:hypothetical protein
MELDLENSDYELITLQDLAYYVRCIPYSDVYYNDVWYASDFLLSLRRGSTVDHALLMAGNLNIKKIYIYITFIFSYIF